MLTKQHFEAVAEILSGNNAIAADSDYGRGYEHGYHAAYKDVATQMADLFAQDNPRFDREKFLAACGF